MSIPNKQQPASPLPDSLLTQIDQFCDILWLEDGLAKNTVDAYRRDMRLFAEWLYPAYQIDLYAVTQAHISAYIAAKHASSKATSANRRLSVLKRFYQLALRLHWVTHDPCLRLKSAKQAERLPKTLSEAQVEALLQAPDQSPLGIRDRTMLELLYACGLRVSELVGLKTLEL